MSIVRILYSESIEPPYKFSKREINKVLYKERGEIIRIIKFKKFKKIYGEGEFKISKRKYDISNIEVVYLLLSKYNFKLNVDDFMVDYPLLVEKMISQGKYHLSKKTINNLSILGNMGLIRILYKNWKKSKKKFYFTANALDYTMLDIDELKDLFRIEYKTSGTVKYTSSLIDLAIGRKYHDKDIREIIKLEQTYGRVLYSIGTMKILTETNRYQLAKALFCSTQIYDSSLLLTALNSKRKCFIKLFCKFEDVIMWPKIVLEVIENYREDEFILYVRRIIEKYKKIKVQSFT